MKTKLTHFYATEADLRRIVLAAERQGTFQYARTGFYGEPRPDVLESGLLIPRLGFTSEPNAINNPCYIVMESGEKIILREVVQFGKIVHSVDEGSNPTCASFLPGGWYENNILLYGRVSSMHESEGSRRIYDRFLSSIVESCNKIRDSYVGQEATKMLMQGARLTGSAHSSNEYDLRIASTQL